MCKFYKKSNLDKTKPLSMSQTKICSSIITEIDNKQQYLCLCI
jgi:hypothetical protein